MSTEAKAFAAGYAAAINLLTPPEAPRGAWCGSSARDIEAGRRAVEILHQCVELVPGLFESWQLSQNADFQESLEQMKRGEGREILPSEFNAIVRKADPVDVDNPSHWSNWNQK